MRTEKMRSEFEQWWVSGNAGIQPRSTWDKLRGGDGYSDEDIEMQWEAWQASRAALVVELPEPFQLANSFTGIEYYYVSEVEKSLRAAGITVRDE